VWKQNNYFAIEKVAFYLLQLLKLVVDLERDNVYCSWDMNFESIVLNGMEKLSLRTEFKDAQKVVEFKQRKYCLSLYKTERELSKMELPHFAEALMTQMRFKVTIFI